MVNKARGDARPTGVWIYPSGNGQSSKRNSCQLLLVPGKSWHKIGACRKACHYKHG